MIEYRTYTLEKRALGDSRTLEGYAAVFNSQSRDLGFIETIAPGAITEETIAQSDVFMRINHDPNKVLARSKYGAGSLQLNVDDVGLHFKFDAPNTDLGNTALEYVKRGDIDECSFGFTIAKEKWEKRDGVVYRTINKIGTLFDTSLVFTAAYGDTSVVKRNKPSDYELQIRSLDAAQNNEQDNMTEDEKIETQEEEQKALETEEPKDEERAEETPAEDPKPEEQEEARACDEEPKDEERAEEPKDEEEKPTQTEENINKENRSIMEKVKVSLTKELRNMKNGDRITLSQLNTRGYTNTDEGVDVVAEETFDVLQQLRAKNVLTTAGARFLTGLDKTVKIPIHNGNTASWEGENDQVDSSYGGFTSIKLEPHRMSIAVPVSLELLAMDSTNVEEIIREDIVRSISDKLEATILGAQDSDDGKRPQGLAYNATKTQISSFADLTYMEAVVEEANYDNANCKYIVAPTFKSTLRNMKKASNDSVVWENDEIDGTPALSTGHIASKNAIYGDWSDLYIAQFGDIDFEVCRDSANLKKGQIELVANLYVDAKPARGDSFKFSYVA